MFDLEIALGKWRQELLAAGLRDFAVISELEGHLRDDVAEQIRRGISPEVAFEAALQRIGKPDQLKTEFALADRSSWMNTLRQHKWKLVLCTALGLLFAGVVHVNKPPVYQSEAILLIRAIVRPADKPAVKHNPGRVPLSEEEQERLSAAMHPEIDILTSLDLARRVAQSIGETKLVTGPHDLNDLNRAMAVIRSGLSVRYAPKSSVLHLAFRHSDAALVQPVLRDVISYYLKMHMEVHRAAGRLEEPWKITDSKITNITEIQSPSTAFKVHKFDAMLAISGGVGFLAGLVWLLAIKLSSGGPRADLRATN
jgi:hypothetical protein